MLDKNVQELLNPCLWEARLEQLDLERDKFVIIERLLEHGGDRQISLLLSTYSPEDIAEVVRQSPYLQPKTVNYWCLRLGLSREETRCFTRPFPSLWPPS